LDKVNAQRPLVLVAGIPRSSFDELAPVLDRQLLEIVQVTSAEDSIKFAYSDRVDLVILDSNPTEMGLEQVVWTIRSTTSASRKASILVLAQPGCEDEARDLIGHGVNRVMLSVDPPKLIALQVAELLNIAPRTTLRLSTRLLAQVTDGAEETLGAVVNLSVTGVLVDTDADLEPGQHVVISIDLPGRGAPLLVKAEVVRKAIPERDGIKGIGARFLEFPDDGRERLEAILGEAFGVPPSEVRTIS
jgi:hypothetical protein